VFKTTLILWIATAISEVLRTPDIDRHTLVAS
jgi:hypothetical protein